MFPDLYSLSVDLQYNGMGYWSSNSNGIYQDAWSVSTYWHYHRWPRSIGSSVGNLWYLVISACQLSYLENLSFLTLQMMLFWFAFKTNEALYIGSVDRAEIHVVSCVLPDCTPVYRFVVKPALDYQHGGTNKLSRVCDVRFKASIRMVMPFHNYCVWQYLYNYNGLYNRRCNASAMFAVSDALNFSAMYRRQMECYTNYSGVNWLLHLNITFSTK